MGKACGGYRDVADLIFKDETENVARRAGSQSEANASGPSTSTTRPSSPEIETEAKQFFFKEFVTADHLLSLEGISPHELLLKPIVACALAAMANRDDDGNRRELPRRYYVEAITATNAALRNPQSAIRDNTLVSVYLLSIFEVFRTLASYVNIH